MSDTVERDDVVLAAGPVSVDEVLVDVDYLVERWEVLVELRLQGTTRRWVEPVHTPIDVLLERSALAKLERAERVGLMPGVHPAPLRIEVLDVLHRVAEVSGDIGRTVADVVGVPLPAGTRSPWKDPRPYLQHARTWLASAQQADERTLPWVIGQVHPLVEVTARQLGELHVGQTLAALCPWCGGRGGDGLEGLRTMQVRYPDPEHGGAAVIVCHGLVCSPPLSSRATRVDGRPTWAEPDWGWLAVRLEQEAA